jgi:hypothetical protein
MHAANRIDLKVDNNYLGQSQGQFTCQDPKRVQFLCSRGWPVLDSYLNCTLFLVWADSRQNCAI